MNGTHVIDKYGAKRYFLYFIIHICEFQSMKGIHVIDEYSAKRYLSYFLIHVWYILNNMIVRNGNEYRDIVYLFRCCLDKSNYVESIL